MEPLAVFTNASNALTLGEMRQLAALDALAFSEDDYDTLIESKTASLFAAACEVGSLCGAQRYRSALTRFGQRLGMAFQVADDLLDLSLIHISEPTRLLSISYAVFCLKKKKKNKKRIAYRV